MSGAEDGRLFRAEVEARAQAREDGRVEVRSPAVGYWRSAPDRGAVVQPGASLGELEILGALHRLTAPAEARGMVVERPAGVRLARIPVGYGDVLLLLDPEAAGAVMEQAASAPGAVMDQGLFLRSPSSGRFYGRPSPDQPPFVSAGDEIGPGQTVALLEVMKTFNRIQYGGSGLPERARVVRVIPENEADLDAGDPILEVEPL